MVTLAAAAAPAAPSPTQTQTQLHVLDGHRVTLDVYPAAAPLRGAAILSHGFTRSRRTLAGHAKALADAGVLVLTPDLPCTFDFRCNARALTALVGLLRAGGSFGAPVDRVMLVGFSAGGLSSLLAADTATSVPRDGCSRSSLEPQTSASYVHTLICTRAPACRAATRPTPSLTWAI